MKKPLLALAAFALTAPLAPAWADGHGDHSAAPKLEDVLAHERRDGDRARDPYRNPAETLAFFQVEPTMTVVEWGPGGGWYTRVLAPYLMPAGKYVAINPDSDGREYRSRAQEAAAKGWTETFKASLAEGMGVEADKVMAFELDEVPEEMKGTVDRALIFRSMHGLHHGNVADDVLKGLRALLKDDGMVGVVQHRAPDGASYADYGARQRGYMREQDVIGLFETAGFELVGSSEVNANPKDPANWEGGVWTLPPSLGFGRQSAEEQAKHNAIGESDRMTLLFKKAD
ncbi:class I SAM-dependent methyltransferase [Altererythrobacter sp. GH1-8]|uniref:class I SAM-dependent methyltransferase n=1 Tax=Altererythrobacter sp. GH1-8 TaxID=3349333 RepID=UPI00374CD6C1